MDTIDFKKLGLASFYLALITFLAFLPSLQNGFVNWDDQQYVYENTKIRTIDLSLLKYAFTSLLASNWHPLTILSHAIDYRLWELEPFGHHLTNNLFHAVNTSLVFILMFVLMHFDANSHSHKSRMFISFMTAILFGIHPVHVESVAWVSERKDLLCAFFFLLSLICYTGYLYSGLKKYYLSSLLLFALALMSKPMAVSLPIILLLLDFFQFQRVRTRSLRVVFLEKLPFVILGLLFSLITLWVQQKGGAIGSIDVLPFDLRLFVAMKAILFYLTKLFFPVSLAPFYPYPDPENVALFSFEALTLFFILLLITITPVFCRKNKKFFFLLWCSFIVMLLPVLGLVQVGQQFAADRYLYLPSIPFFFFTASLFAALIDLSTKKHRLLAGTLFFFIIVFFSVKTLRQSLIWRDSIKLWSYEIKLYPGRVGLAYNNRGQAYLDKGDEGRALEDFNVAISISPGYALPYNNRAKIYNAEGRYDDALRDMASAISLDSDRAELYNNRGFTLINAGNYDEAVVSFTKAIALDSGAVFHYIGRGRSYTLLGRFDLSLDDLNKAISLSPVDKTIFFDRGMTYGAMGKPDLAIKDFNQALAIDFDFAAAHYNRGIAYSKIGRDDLAMQDFNAAIKIDGNYIAAYNGRAILYGSGGQYELAIKDYEEIINLDADNGIAYYNKALIYLKKKETHEALRAFRQAERLGVERAKVKLMDMES